MVSCSKSIFSEMEVFFQKFRVIQYNLYFLGCRSVKYDVVFNVDSSASVGDSDFDKVRQWISNLVKTFEIGSDATRVGIIVFSDEPKLDIKLDTFFDKTALLTAIKGR